MKLSRLKRLERLPGRTVCPLCVRGMGLQYSEIVEDDTPPDPVLYTCPVCGARPESLKLIHIPFSDDSALPSEERAERARLRVLMAGDPNGPRARAVADVIAKRSDQRGRKPAKTTPTSRKISP